MKVGVPKEVKNHEYRVAITPIGVHELSAHGHEVFVEKSAGLGSQIEDSEFEAAGAKILESADEVWGIAKAYVTRVGEGPFPSEIEGPNQERVRELGGEFGTVTGRERRCGWLDLVALRYAVRLNGITSLALTKLDVLSAFADLPVCVRYRLRDGSETGDFPAHQSDFHHAAPVWETLAGWSEPLDSASTRDDLPDAARGYVEFVERELEVPVELVGVGAERERVLV